MPSSPDLESEGLSGKPSQERELRHRGGGGFSETPPTPASGTAFRAGNSREAQGRKSLLSDPPPTLPGIWEPDHSANLDLRDQASLARTLYAFPTAPEADSTNQSPVPDTPYTSPRLLWAAFQSRLGTQGKAPCLPALTRALLSAS